MCAAAHCFVGLNLDSDDFFIVAGIVKAKDFTSNLQKVYVERIIIHEDYNSKYVNNDIAILKLKTSLIFNDRVQPACLPDASFAPEKSGGVGIVSGFGIISEGKNTVSNQIFCKKLERYSTLVDFHFSDGVPADTLQYLPMPLIANEKCVEPYTEWPGITPEMLCAGYIEG